MSDTASALIPRGFHHEAVLYVDDDEFLDGTLQFLHDGFDADEAAFVVVSRSKIRALRGELRGESGRVTFADMDEVGRNPACIIPAWARFVARDGVGGTRLRGIGEPVSPDRTPAELLECDLHERLLNVAFGDDTDFWLRCPYDASRLDHEIIAGVHNAHDSVMRDRVSESVELDRSRLVAAFGAPLDEPSTTVTASTFDDEGGIALLRECMRRRAGELRLSDATIDDFVLAIHEVATNSLRYGGGIGDVRVWDDDTALVCEVRDRGHITDPLVGRRAPAPDAPGGRGMWIANHLADLVQLRSSGDGTTVRVHARLP